MWKAGQERQIRLHSVTKQKMAQFGSMLYFRVAFISLLFSLASGDCVDLDLGMENGAILDSKITASSQQSASTPAKNGRLNYTSGSSWCAQTSDSNPYLQIDLQTLHIICAVSTQGNSRADRWVKTYTLQTSIVGSSSWTDYKEDGVVKTFVGNNDRNSEVKHVLYGVLTRFLRFLPKTHQGRVCMRTEVFGVKKKPENLALGKPTGQSSTNNYNSTVRGVSGNAVDGNPDTDFGNGHCSRTNAANPSWWRVDLGANLVPVSEIYIVNSNAQQGNKDYKITLGSSSDVTTNDACKGLYSFVDFKASALCFINPLTTGRYVGIMTTKSQVLQLCEVEIYSRENLAYGKPTDQSFSVYKDGKSSKAVDGNSNSNFMGGATEGSCTMTQRKGSVAPWWRVDLQQVEHVSEVYIVNRGSECGCSGRFQNFEIRVGMVANGESSANPKCGDTYTYKFPVGEGRSFFCHPSLKGRYVIVRFVDKDKPLTLCEVEVYSERRACPMQAIGVASSDAFPDDSFSASSSSSGYEASKGRLYGAGAWSPSNNNDVNDYLQIDLLYEFVICAVATQGKPSADHWTTKYKLQLALIDHANNWFTYQEDSIDKEFDGNSGKSDIVKHSLKEHASARFIRFQPTDYETHKALRVEVFGILISAVPSQAPSGFTVAASTSTSITASWQLPPKYARHGNITGFKLFYSKKDSDGSPTMYTVTSLTRVVSGLDEYTEYEFQVLAFSSRGDGPKSSVVVERTKEDAPTGAPDNFNARAITSTSIEASWQLPPEDSRNGNIIGFRLFYQKSGSGTSTMLTIQNQGTLTKNVTGLEKYTVYEFQVLAYTSVGDGPNSSSIVKRTKEDVPSQPPTSISLAARTSTSIEMSWKLPPEDAWNGVIKGFKLYYKKKNTPGSLTRFLVVNNGAARSEIVSGLAKYTNYAFQVLAYTSAGDGPKSSVEHETTMEDVPSKAPSSLSLTAKTSTSIEASWQLPPADGRNGIIKGFRLFYKRKSSSGSSTPLTINSESTLTKVVSGLDEYTEYEFQVLAFTSKGDGPKSDPESTTTKEDKPSKAPDGFTVTATTSTSITASWQLPPADGRNGIITGFKLFYKKKGFAGSQIIETVNSGSTRTRVVNGLDKYTEYEFQVLAYTSVGDGPKSTVKYERTEEDRPSVGPANVSFVSFNKTTFNISWAPLTREKSHGKVVLYDVKGELLSRGKHRKRSLSNSSRTLNTTTTFVVLYDLSLCSQYHVFVRAYTKVGPGPYSQPMALVTSKPKAPSDLRATNSGSTEVTLEWTQPSLTTKEGLSYTVKYSGTKSYNKTFKDTGDKNVGKSTKYAVLDLVPGSSYEFQVYGTSVCGQSSPIKLKVETEIAAPIAPVFRTLTNVTVSESAAGIYLWPVEQRNGPISVYQVIVLKVVDEAEDLPDDYDLKLKDANNANEENLNFYITAEIPNDPVYKESWEFTVGDDNSYEGFVNKALERGEEYVIFQRAVTRDSGGNLPVAGVPSRVAKISVTPKDEGTTDNSKDSGSPNAAAIAVPVVLLVVIIPAFVGVVFWYRRRKQPEPKRDRSSGNPVELDELKNDSPDMTASTSNLVYQNVAQLQQSAKAVDKKAPPLEEKEAIYSEPEDGKPKPIPVAEFARYFKCKSENGAIVLREEFKNLPGGMQFPWEIGKDNRAKNRYGNIVSYDHSRVVLEKIEGDAKSDYINASYIPTFDEVSMCYIATQGPTPASISDFWRMIWQENCLTIVMLTNLVEQGKAKCDQYWPESTTKYGSITVTSHKTESFADYVVRTLIVVKNSEKREVHQFHYVTWPDKGVPQHSTALLGFRSKIHARHQATGGPLVVHCSAGVGRTGTFIGIDAMLEGAKENQSVFIQNYVQVMRRCRPHMVQKDDQYVFLHQAVMEALVGGDTEIVPQDLRISMNKLARIHKTSKKNGYAREFKRLELVTDIDASPEEATAAFKPSNINKNRFPNIVPLDIARVFLMSSDPEKNYVNASFVDDYRLRNAYILTQAPLDTTVEDFWRMISQYDIGTIVMLNSLREKKESYPQYWPEEGSPLKYGDIAIQILSENTLDKITTRKFSVSNVQSPKKTSTVNHLQFTGWADCHTCPDPQEILELLTAIQHSQQRTGNGVILFQCSDGVGRSGCVSTIMSVIERVKTEQTVDVFQTVKLIRAKRPGAVVTLEQYMFCYQTILAYLDSFNTYANFAEC